MTEIGGYLQLEELAGEEYYRDLLRLNLGRTALLYALQTLGARKLYLPRLICDSLTSICERWGGEMAWYSITDDLLPCEEDISDRDAAVLVINYYGQLSDDQIRELHAVYPHLICDNTHSFYQRPVAGVPTLYSCRKYFGVPDGAYLYLPTSSDMPGVPATYAELPQDTSSARMAHILGRYEQGARPFYSTMLETADTFYDEPIARMSLLTQDLLKGIDYAAAKARREENHRVLDSLLGTRNGRHFNMSEGPFVYPFYTEAAPTLKKQLAEQDIFIPTYWNNVIEQLPEDSLEWDLAAHILPLPIDQRYTPDDMEHMATELLARL